MSSGQRERAEADAAAATSALGQSYTQRDAELSEIRQKLDTSQKRVEIVRKIEHVTRDPNCTSVGPEFVRLHNAGLSNIIYIPAQRPASTGDVPAPSADNPAVAP